MQEKSFGIDQFLLTALQNPKDRLILMKLDQELEIFVKDNSRNRLEFPPTSSYQRLIIHRVAQYFNLEHIVVDVEGGKRAVVLLKTSGTKIPVLRFVDLIVSEESCVEGTSLNGLPVQIMRRQNGIQRSSRNTDNSGPSSLHSLPYSANNGDNGKTSTKDKSLEQREKEYAKARARIFGNATNQNEAEGLDLEKVTPQFTMISNTQNGKDGFSDVRLLQTEDLITTSPHNAQISTPQISPPQASINPSNIPSQQNRSFDESKGSNSKGGTNAEQQSTDVPNNLNPRVSGNLSNGRRIVMDGENIHGYLNQPFLQGGSTKWDKPLTVPYTSHGPLEPSLVQPLVEINTNLSSDPIATTHFEENLFKASTLGMGSSNGREVSSVTPPILPMLSPFEVGYGYPPSLPPTVPSLVYSYGYGHDYDEMSLYNSSNGLFGYQNGTPSFASPSLPTHTYVNPYYYNYNTQQEYKRGPVYGQLFDPHAPTSTNSLHSHNQHYQQQPYSQKTKLHRSLRYRDEFKTGQTFPKSPSYESFFASSPSGFRGATMNSTKVRTSDTAVTTVVQKELDHILQISGLSSNPPSEDECELLQKIKASGATVKWIDSNTPLAIYRSSALAREAMKKFQNLHPWRMPTIVLPTNPPTPSPSLQITTLVSSQEFI